VVSAQSPYHQVKFSTVEMYDRNLDLLEQTVGSRHLSRLSGLDFQRWYNKFKEPSVDGGEERKRTAYQAMQTLRVIVKFGIVANITECARLAVVLEQMRFHVPASRAYRAHHFRTGSGDLHKGSREEQNINCDCSGSSVRADITPDRRHWSVGAA